MIKRVNLSPIAIITALAIALGVCFSSIAPKKAFAAEDYHTWSQMDPRWGSTPMGNTTVARSGCLITSLSIMARASNSLDAAALKNLGVSSVDDFNPGVLAKAYTKVGGFSSGGGIASWGTIHQLIPSITFIGDARFNSSDVAGMAAEIKAKMASGQHIVVNVNGHHWVYIEGVVGNDIYMIDPANGAGIVTDFYTLSGKNEYWSLKGKNAPAAFTPPPAYKIERLGEPVEYYMTESEKAFALPEKDSENVSSVEAGLVAKVSATCDGYGLIENNGKEVGWIKLDRARLLSSAPAVIPGDINGDGAADEYDLAVLNEYLLVKDSLPEGFSTLSEAELKAADVDSDGVVDKNDTLAYLAALCG